ncbi:isopenicillin N synthase family dioxygenase [Muricoccus radiodurans]|uniref:isopenicillin N synthase family dioxygenase n=1 Tax=Muricoccus radiodurans TaxID=2231721 RepID=UPI003CEE9D4C
MTDRIPTLDFASFRTGDAAARRDVANALGALFENYGFVSLVGHGLPRPLIADAFAAAESFFALPEPEKRAVQDRRNNRGYIPMFDGQRPGEKPSGNEAFSIGHPDRPADPELRELPFHAETPWPPAMPSMRAGIEPLYRAMFSLGEDILSAAALHLGAPETFFAEMSRETYSNMRVVHYPPQEAVAETSDYGVVAHVDRGLITLLIQDMNGGLSVRAPSGDWLPVVPDPEAIVINVGALLRRWTNGRYLAALHRVTNTSGRERYSIPLFVHPSFHTRIDPVTLVGQPPAAPEFEPIVAGEETFAGFLRDRPSWRATAA